HSSIHLLFSALYTATTPALPTFPTRRSSDLSVRFSARCSTVTSASRDGDQPGRPRVPNAAAKSSSPIHSPSRSRDKTRQRLEVRSEEHTSELQSRSDLVCRLLLEKKKLTLIN